MHSFGKALLVSGAVLMVYGAGLFLGQGISWLAGERWVRLPLLLLMMDHAAPYSMSTVSIASSPESYLWPLIPRISPLPSWIIAPRHWLGAHRVAVALLTQASVPGTAVLLGLAALWAGVKLTKSR